MQGAVMKSAIPGVEPVYIALDSIEAGAEVRFNGIDLETGSRVVVSIDRSQRQPTPYHPTHEASGLVLVLTIESISAAH